MRTWLVSGLLALTLLGGPARAEVAEVTLGQQFALSFLPVMYMEHARLVEKHAVRLGLPEPKVSWVKLAGPANLNDAMISGAIQFAALGPPATALMWDRTRGDVKALAGICAYPLYLNTRSPGVKSLKDFTEKDKIALTSVKISFQAILLQMQAEKEFGQGQHTRIDPVTVSLANPDAMAALLGNTEVTAHFGTSPFHETEIKDPRVHTVMTSYDILGGPSTAALLIGSERFRRANPKTFEAVRAALKEAIDAVNADKAAAAALYLKLAGGRSTAAELEAILSHPDWEFTLAPRKIERTASFMNRIGLIKATPRSWKDLFFPEAHDLPGD
jgi:NitT/TauT family transport system substrate-binding protein